MKPHAAVAVVVSCLAAVAPAHADVPTPEARSRAAQSFASGKAAFARGDFAGAGAAFEQAALYVFHPAPLLDAAEAWELAGDRVRAARLCDRVIEAPSVESRFGDAARAQLARLEMKISTAVVRAVPGARITIDDVKDDASGRRVRLVAGAHTATITASTGDVRNETFSVATGETKELRFELPVTPTRTEPTHEAPAPAPAAPVTSSSGPPLGTWIAFGVTAVAGGVAVVYGVRTLDAKKDFDANPTTSSRDDFYGARAITNVSLGVAAAGAIVGAVLWIALPRTSPAKTVGLRMREDGGILRAELAF